MKHLENLKSLIPKITREGARLYTNQLGTENLLVVSTDAKNLLRFWRCTTLKEEAISTLAICYGENGAGGMVVYDKEAEFLADFGKGKQTGFAFLLQRVEDVYFISIFDDVDGESTKFFMTGTDDGDAVAIIITLLSHFVKDIGTVYHVQELLKNVETERKYLAEASNE